MTNCLPVAPNGASITVSENLVRQACGAAQERGYTWNMSATITKVPATSLDVRSSHLGESEVRAILQAKPSPELVGEVYALARAVGAEESARQARLDSKAGGLLTASGISATVASALMPHTHGLLSKVALGMTGLCGLGAAVLAVHALRIATYERIPDTTIFDADFLRKFDEEEKVGAKAAARYQRFVLPQIWSSHRKAVVVNDQRATAITFGQYALFAMFVLALVSGIVVSFGK